MKTKTLKHVAITLLLPLFVSQFYSGSQQGSGNCLSFDGVDDYVELTTFTTFSAQSFTLSSWIQTTSSTDQTIVSKLNEPLINNKWQFICRIRPSGAIHMKFYGTTTSSNQRNYVTDENGFNDGEWHHIAVVVVDIDGSITKTVRIYVDGVEKTISNTFLNNQSDTYGNKSVPIWIGAYDIGSGIGGPFNGQIDEVRIYNVARTQEQIRQYMCMHIPNPQGNSTLVGYWKFDEGSGNIAYDSSGNGNHGTLY